MRDVRIQDAKGNEKVVSESVWSNMGSSRENGNTRKGWTILGKINAKPAAGAAPTKGPTFAPPELEASSAGAQAQDAPPAKPEAEQQKPKEQPAQTAPSTEARAESKAKPSELMAIPSVGAKASEALGSIGIHTFADLVAAQVSAIESALDAANLSPKKAQIPNWIKWAADNKK